MSYECVRSYICSVPSVNDRDVSLSLMMAVGTKR